MAWIKRNLFFVIGSLIAVALMVLGIFYLLGQINDENQVTEEIQKQYEELKTLAQQNPHPGNDKIDNIKAAKEQQGVLSDHLKKERLLFQHIGSIPDAPAGKISNADFARELRNTVDLLRRSAKQQSVQLPLDYYFTFEAQRKSLIFEAGTLDRLASHLGEVKALSDALFTAKINFLDGIQREIISTNQDTNPSDYLTTQKTISTPLADLTPYRVTFRCFSADLAEALANLANSPYGFVVESINVEPVNTMDLTGNNGVMPSFVQPQPPSPGPGIPAEGGPRFRQPFPGQPNVAAPAATPAVAGGRPVPFLIEKPFRVTLLVEVVKPKAPVK